MAGVTAVLDACVLHSAPLRDLLLRLSKAGVFRAKLTDQIHDEWIRSALARRPDLSLERLARTRQLMNMHSLDCLVTGHESLIDAITLPDPDDRHVLAAAIHCNAAAVVTFNLRDFPADALARFSIEAWPPDAFLAGLWEADAEAFVAAVRRQRLALKSPPVTAERLLKTFRDQGLVEIAARLSSRIDDL